jgi:hypothetical protein
VQLGGKVVVLSLNAKLSGILTPSASKASKEWPSFPSKGKAVTKEDELVVSLSQDLEDRS